jgi:hypothetical protein
VEKIIDFPSLTRERTCNFMVEDGAATQSTFFHWTLRNDYSNSTRSIDKEDEPSRRMSMISIAYMLEMISWKQRINKLQGLLVDCI